MIYWLLNMGSTELNENGTHKGDSLKGSNDTPMYNPHVLPLRFVRWDIYQKTVSFLVLRCVYFWGIFYSFFHSKSLNTNLNALSKEGLNLTLGFLLNIYIAWVQVWHVLYFFRLLSKSLRHITDSTQSEYIYIKHICLVHSSTHISQRESD